MGYAVIAVTCALFESVKCQGWGWGWGWDNPHCTTCLYTWMDNDIRMSIRSHLWDRPSL
jgi:hypothetical protein